MTTILLIKKNGDIESQQYKNLKKDDLYKKCNYRKNDDFEQQASWKVKTNGQSVRVCVYGKSNGKSTMVNKFEFPPPIDTKLLYGTLAITKEQDDNLLNISEEEWLKIYEKIYGGFEDLDATAADDENEEDELDDVDEEMKTKTGYLKDDFVVDDGTVSKKSTSESEEEEDDDDESSEENSDNYSNSDISEQEYVMSSEEE